MAHEIGGRHETAQNEGGRTREQPDQDQHASDKLDQAGDPHQRNDRGRLRKVIRLRKREVFLRAVLNREQRGDDAKESKTLRRPMGKAIEHHCSPADFKADNRQPLAAKEFLICELIKL